MKLFRRKEIHYIRYYFLFIPLPWRIGYRLYFGYWPPKRLKSLVV